VSAATFAAAAAAAAEGRADEIRFVSHILTTQTIDPTTGFAFFRFETDGDLDFRADTGETPAVIATEWHRDNIIAGLGNDWEVRVTKTAGTNPSAGDTLNFWHPLTSSRFWRNDTAAVGVTVTSTLTIEFRLAGTTTVLKTLTGMVIAAVMDP